MIGTFLFLTIFNFLLARFQLPVRNTYHPCKERGGCGDHVHPKLRLHLERSQQWLTGETQPDLAIKSWPMWVQRSLQVCILTLNSIQFKSFWWMLSCMSISTFYGQWCCAGCPLSSSGMSTSSQRSGLIITASVKMSWWTTGASLEGILFQKAVV